MSARTSTNAREAREAREAAHGYLSACSDEAPKVRARRFGSATRYRVSLGVPHGCDFTGWYASADDEAMWAEAARIARRAAEDYAAELDDEGISLIEGARWTRDHVAATDVMLPEPLRAKVLASYDEEPPTT